MVSHYDFTLGPKQSFHLNFPNHTPAVVLHVFLFKIHLVSLTPAPGKVLGILNGKYAAITMIPLHWNILWMCKSPVCKVQTRVFLDFVLGVKVAQ